MEKWGDVQIDRDDIRKARKARSAGGQRSWRLGSGAFGAMLVFGACGGVPTSPVAAVAADGAPRQAPALAAEGPDSGGIIEPQVCASCTPPLIYFTGPRPARSYPVDRVHSSQIDYVTRRSGASGPVRHSSQSHSESRCGPEV